MKRNIRNWYLGKIHEDARTLNLTDRAYRNVLYSLTGKRTCKDMGADELVKVSTFFGCEVYSRMPPVSDDEALAVLA